MLEIAPALDIWLDVVILHAMPLSSLKPPSGLSMTLKHAHIMQLQVMINGTISKTINIDCS